MALHIPQTVIAAIGISSDGSSCGAMGEEQILDSLEKYRERHTTLPLCRKGVRHWKATELVRTGIADFVAKRAFKVISGSY